MPLSLSPLLLVSLAGRNTLNEVDRRFPVPPFLAGENPAHERYHEATELFALFDYLKSQRFGIFSIRESLQAVGERRPMEEENHAAVAEVYRALGAGERVKYVWYAGDHDFPPVSRKAAVEWFRKWLGGK